MKRKRNFTLVGLLALVGCGEPVISRVGPQPSLAVPPTNRIVKTTESVAKLDEAESKITKPQSTDDPVAVSFRASQIALRAGDTFEISVDFDIALSYEINDRFASPPAVPTLLELELPPGFEAVEEWSDPKSVPSESPDGHSVYVGNATFKRRIRSVNNIAPGQYTLVCSFGYQACNARQCLRPVHGRLHVSLTIQS